MQAAITWIDEHRADTLDLLRSLISYKSVKGKAAPGKPFGEGVDACYRYFLARAEADGFETCDVDGYGGHALWRGVDADEDGNPVAATETLGIPVHLDVVPEGDGWDSPPYAMEERDGMLFGRGTIDDKGPAASVYMAMVALKTQGFVPKKNVKLIFGLDEETGWAGMKKYLEKCPAPDFGFVPDGAFPAIHGEKGIMDFQIAKKLAATKEKGLALTGISGGNAGNMVPDHAQAVLLADGGGYEQVKNLLAEFRMATGYEIHGKGVGKAFKVEVTGVSAHASLPESGVNAISILLAFLGKVGLANESVREFIDFYNTHIGMEYYGESLGIGFTDEASGRLTLNAGLIEMDKEAVIVTFNARHPVTIKEDAVYDAMLPLIHRLDMGLVKLDYKAPIYFAKDDPFITALVDVYREESGDTEGQPFTIGGGTYARAIPNAVAFGPEFPGEPKTMHQKNEFIYTESLHRLTHIYAKAIYRLTGGA